jgi:uncharacterized protein (DUF58 family)
MALRPSSHKATATLARAQTLSATLPPLMAEAERVANTVQQGTHGRRRVGPGESFWQFRRYSTGDEATAVDWRQSARSQHLFVRENEWDAAQSAWIWCDQSVSMDYHSEFSETSKQDRAIVLALALANLLARGGERIAALGTDAPPNNSRHTLHQLAESWINLTSSQDTQSGLPPAQPLPRYASLILIGDFLEPTEELIARLRKLSHTGARGHLLQVLDPAETDLPFEGRTEFEGVKEDLKLLVGRAEGLRVAYKQRLASHQDQLREMTRSVGWTFATHRTDAPATNALLTLYGVISGDHDVNQAGGRL